MRRLLLILLATGCYMPLSAQSLKDFWVSMPDSVVSYLTESMRTELLECKEKHVTASVKNRLEGTTTMDTLTANYLSATLSESTTMQIRRMPYQEDSVFCVVTTYLGPVADSKIAMYTKDWKPMDMKHIFDGKCINCVRKQLVQKPKEMQPERFEEIKQMIDPMLVKVILSPDADELMMEANTEVLKNEEKKIIDSVISKIRFIWTGEMFKKVI